MKEDYGSEAIYKNSRSALADESYEELFDSEFPEWCKSRLNTSLLLLAILDPSNGYDRLLPILDADDPTLLISELIKIVPLSDEQRHEYDNANTIQCISLLGQVLENLVFDHFLRYRAHTVCQQTAGGFKPYIAIVIAASRLKIIGINGQGKQSRPSFHPMTFSQACLIVFGKPFSEADFLIAHGEQEEVRVKFREICTDPVIRAEVNQQVNAYHKLAMPHVLSKLTTDVDNLIVGLYGTAQPKIARELFGDASPFNSSENRQAYLDIWAQIHRAEVPKNRAGRQRGGTNRLKGKVTLIKEKEVREESIVRAMHTLYEKAERSLDNPKDVEDEDLFGQFVLKRVKRLDRIAEIHLLLTCKKYLAKELGKTRARLDDWLCGSNGVGKIDLSTIARRVSKDCVSKKLILK